MIDVRHAPSIWTAPFPRSTQNVLYPPTLPAAPADPSPPTGGAWVGVARVGRGAFVALI